jgi:hypothetical protein
MRVKRRGRGGEKVPIVPKNTKVPKIKAIEEEGSEGTRGRGSV